MNTENNETIISEQNNIPKQPKKSSKVKLIIIIIVIIAIISCVAVVLLSSKENKQENNNTTTTTTKSTDDEKKKDDEPQFVYYYKVRKNNEDKYLSFSKDMNDDEDTTYTLIKKYDCNGKCGSDVYTTPTFESTLYIVDDEILYSYNKTFDRMEEVDTTNKIEGDNVNFLNNFNLVIIYTDSGVKAGKGFVSLDIPKEDVIQGKKVKYTSTISASDNGLRDKIYAIRDDFTEYSIYSIYQGTSKLSELKEKDLGPIKDINTHYYVSDIKFEDKTLLVSENGKLQFLVKKDEYELESNNRMLLKREDGTIEAYQDETLIGKISETNSKILQNGYAAYIKDKKLVIANLYENKTIYEFTGIEDNYEFINKGKYFSEYVSYDEIKVFLKDKKISDDYSINGKEFIYNIKTQKATITDRKELLPAVD